VCCRFSSIIISEIINIIIILRGGKFYIEIYIRNRFFRKVYQHYGSPEGYALQPDALPFLEWATSQGYMLGVVSNTPTRTIDTVLPFLGLHHYFRFFVCSHELGIEKPGASIFQHAFEVVRRDRRSLGL